MQIRVKRKKTVAEVIENVGLFCLIMPLIKPDGISNINATISNLIWNIGQQVAGVLCVLLFLFHFYRKKRLTLSGGVILIFLLITLGLSYFRGGSLQYWYINFSNAVFIAMLFETYQDKLPRFISVVLTYLKILLLINLFCMIMYPNGMYVTKTMNYSLNWLLGYKSSLQYYVIPAVTLGWISEYCLGKKKSFWLLLTVCFIQTLYSQNTMLLVILLFMIAFFVFKIYKVSKVFNGFTYIVGGVLVNFFVLFYVSFFVQSSLGQAIFGFFGKDITLSGRSSKIWPRALYYIRKEFVFGYGVISSEKHVGMLGMPAAIHAHNQILELMICGGVFLLLLFFSVLVIMGVRMFKTQELEVTQVLGLTIFLILVMTSVEVFTRGCGTGIWLIFLLAGVTQQLNQQYAPLASNKNVKQKKIKFRIY